MMESERIFIIGDIHGCLEMLKRLMDKIDWDPDKDRLIFLGDYIDRGKDSRGVIDFILEISKIAHSVECLLGNHESILLDFLEGRDYVTFFLNGGAATLNSYRLAHHIEGEPLIPEGHLSFLKSLRKWIELEDYYVVHAGFRPGVDLENQTLEDLLWIREPFIFSEYDFGKRIIFGHTPFSEPVMMENKIGLDTGAVYGNKLTCLELPALKFHWVEAIDLA
ncbi:MAG: metallophosphoesterase family protein [Desulfobacteraceae bacterium]|jgi:serine/threonine protein phosphatase 1